MSATTSASPVVVSRTASWRDHYLLRHLAAHVADLAEDEPARWHELFHEVEQGGLILRQAEAFESFAVPSETVEAYLLPAAIALGDGSRFVRCALMAANLRGLAQALAEAGALVALARSGRGAMALALVAQLPSPAERAKALAALAAELASEQQVIEELDLQRAPANDAEADAWVDVLGEVARHLAARLSAHLPRWLDRLRPWPALEMAARVTIARRWSERDEPLTEVFWGLVLASPVTEPWDEALPACLERAAGSPESLVDELLRLPPRWDRVVATSLAALLHRVALDSAERARALWQRLGSPVAILRSAAALERARGFVSRLSGWELIELADALQAPVLAARLWVLHSEATGAWPSCREVLRLLPALDRRVALPLALRCLAIPSASQAADCKRRFDAVWAAVEASGFELGAPDLARLLDLVARFRPRRLRSKIARLLASPVGRSETLLAVAGAVRERTVLEALLARVEIWSAMVADDHAAGFELRARLLILLACRLSERSPDAVVLDDVRSRLLPEEEDDLRAALAATFVSTGHRDGARQMVNGMRSPSRWLAASLRFETLSESEQLGPAALYRAVFAAARVEDERLALAALAELPIAPASIARDRLASMSDRSRRLLALADLARHALVFQHENLEPVRQDPSAAILPLKEALGVIESESWMVSFLPELVSLGGTLGAKQALAEHQEAIERLLGLESVEWALRRETLARLLDRAAEGVGGASARRRFWDLSARPWREALWRWIERRAHGAGASPKLHELAALAAMSRARATMLGPPPAPPLALEALVEAIRTGTAGTRDPRWLESRRALWALAPARSSRPLMVATWEALRRGGAEAGIEAVCWWLNAHLRPYLGAAAAEGASRAEGLQEAIQAAGELGATATARAPSETSQEAPCEDASEPAMRTRLERVYARSKGTGRWLHPRTWAPRAPSSQPVGVLLVVLLFTAVVLSTVGDLPSENAKGRAAMVAPWSSPLRIGLAGWLVAWLLGVALARRFLLAQAAARGLSVRTWIGWLVGAVGGFPLYGLLLFPVWARWLISGAPPWMEQDPGRIDAFPGLASKARGLASHWGFLAHVLLGLAAVQALVLALGLEAPSRPGVALARDLVAWALRLAGVALMIVFYRLQRRAREDPPWRALLFGLVTLLWLLPTPASPFFGLLGYFLVEPNELNQSLASGLRSLSSGSSLRWIELLARLRAAPRPSLPRYLLGRVPPIADATEPSRDEQKLAWFCWGKTAVLLFDAWTLGDLLSAATGRRATFLDWVEWTLLALGGLATLAWMSLFLGVAAGSRWATLRRWKEGDVPRIALALLVAAVGFGVGLNAGRGALTEAGARLALFSLGAMVVSMLPILLMIIIPIPQPHEASHLRQLGTLLGLGWLGLFGVTMASGSGPLALQPDLPPLSALGVLIGLVFARVLPAPLPARAAFSSTLTRRQRWLVRFVLVTAVLPGGGLLVPVWMFLRRRYWPAISERWFASAPAGFPGSSAAPAGRDDWP